MPTTEDYIIEPDGVLDIADAASLEAGKSYTIEVSYPGGGFLFLWESDDPIDAAVIKGRREGGHVLRWGYPRVKEFADGTHWYVHNHSYSSVNLAVTASS